MKNWKFLVAVCAIVLATNTISAQANLLNAKIPEEIGVKTAEQLAADNDKPLQYGYIDDRDILWSKVVWEYIDLNEKINLPFYYPVDTNNISSSRRSLFDTLLRGINRGEIVDVYDDSYFENKLTSKEISGRLSRIDTSDAGFELLNEGSELTDEYIDRIDLTSGEFEVLWYLMENAGQNVSRDDLYLEIRGLEYDGFDRSIDLRISHIRKKMDDEKAPYKYLKTIRNKGYQFAV